MVAHSWILEMSKMVKTVDNVKSLLCGSMDGFDIAWEVLGEVWIKHGILQEDSLSHLFALALISLTMLIKDRRWGIGSRKIGKTSVYRQLEVLW